MLPPAQAFVIPTLALTC